MRKQSRIRPFLRWIEEEWMNNPDYRFGQLLVNLGIVEDGRYTWSSELQDYKIPHEQARKIFSWTVRLTKDNFQIEKVVGGWETTLKDYSYDTFWQYYFKKPTVKEIIKSYPNGVELSICQLTIKHIKAILKTQKQIKGTYMEDLMKEELKYRKKNKIK